VNGDLANKTFNTVLEHSIEELKYKYAKSEHSADSRGPVSHCLYTRSTPSVIGLMTESSCNLRHLESAIESKTPRSLLTGRPLRWPLCVARPGLVMHRHQSHRSDFGRLARSDYW
jgi:hypothetical protein